MRERQPRDKQEASKVATAMVTKMRVNGTVSKNIQGGSSHGDEDHCNHAIASPPNKAMRASAIDPDLFCGGVGGWCGGMPRR